MAIIERLASSFWTTAASVLAWSGCAVVLAVWFGLTVAGALALYFVVWWTVLFAILPVGVRSQAEVGEIATGTDPGAPAAPALRQKTLWTTFAAGLALVAAAGLLPLAGL
jgi:predicted secreted protein